MAQQTLLGGDGTSGESGATHNSKANANFTELYGATATAQSTADSANSNISNHISDSSDAHDASAISFAPGGSGLSSTDVNAAIIELAGASGVADASITVKGIIEIATEAEAVTGTDTARAVTPKGVHDKFVGVHDLFVPATGMWPRVTNGCSPLAQTELTTSLFNIQSLDFNQTTQQYAQFQITLPRNWNNGTITFRPYWTAGAGSGGVVWELSGGAYSDGDALTVAFGTAQSSTDTLTTVNYLHIGPESSAITLAGTPADADFLGLQISRVTGNGSDTLSNDAKLLGISVRLTTDAGKDA